MGLALATTIGLVVWIVLWAIGWKSIDAFMITAVIITLGATAKILAPYLPGRH
ncbi:MAG TPA: hypothetical protein VNT54_08125 [Solirubrobacteraceae bacterium]|nr:hypothetical protein [Solirubrobacteraceae bacterium]